MSKILVTGAKGQVGQALAKIANSDFVFTSKGDLDITDALAVAEFLKIGKYDYVVNCAAYTAVDKAESEEEICRDVNVNGVRNLAKHCKMNNSILIHISSDYVYHPSDNLPIDEGDPCTPKGVYALTKLQGEEEIRKLQEEHVILRTSWVYSARGQNFVKTMLRLSESTNTVNVVCDQIGSPTYAGDLARTLLTIIHKTKSFGTYNYSNLGYISWSEFAQEIFKQANKQVVVKEITSEQYVTPAARPLNSRLIKSKIADDYGITLKHWKRSLAKCLEEIDNSMA